MRRPLSAAILALAACLAAPPAPAQPALLTATTAAPLQQAALDAYFYLYPLVAMDLARRQAGAASAAGQPGAAAPNSFWRQRAAAMPGGVWPHADMLRLQAWLDLSDGPVVIEVPATQGRLYLLTLQDLWGEAFAVLSKRSTGSAAGRYAVMPPGWTGSLPAGTQALPAPTRHVNVQGLLQADGADAPALLEGFRIAPLQNWQHSTQSVQLRADPGLDSRTPAGRQLEAMSAEAFFSYGAELLRKHPPHAADQPMLARLRRVGIVPGQPLAFDKLSQTQQQALRHAVREAPGYLTTPVGAPASQGWVAEREALGNYGNAYLKRAQMARYRPTAELPQEILNFRLQADAQGQPIDAQAHYVLRFEADALPPGEAFWSLATFDADGQPLADRLGRTQLGDRHPLRYHPDGALELYLQAEPVAEPDRNNWLALSPRTASIVLRIYQPAPAALYGRWNPPAVQRHDDSHETQPSNIEANSP